MVSRRELDIMERVYALIAAGNFEESGRLMRETGLGQYDDEEFEVTDEVVESETARLQTELTSDPAWIAASRQTKCHTCWNLDARGHPQAEAQRSGRQIISSVEYQLLNMPLVRVVWQTEACGYCDLIFRAANKVLSRDERHRHAWPQYLQSVTLVEGQPVLLTVSSPTEPGKIDILGIEMFTDPNDVEMQRLLPAVGSAGPVAADANSDACFDFITSCLKECTETHNDCKQRSPPLPKRVLVLEEDTKGGNQASKPSVRLCHSRPSEKHPYVALSHCWGPDKTAKVRLKLQRNNVAELQQSIPWNRMPETFKDGILATWRLGIRHIWIDSLCIIQDDTADWETEATKMGAYYHNAYLTIAAASSPCGDERFLTTRPGLNEAEEIKFYGPQKVSLASRMARRMGSWRGTVYARRTQRKANNDRSAVAGWSRIETSTITGPLSTRAWTLQERVLSARIVHFTEEGVIWECKQVTRSEDRMARPAGPLSKWSQFEAVRNISDTKERKTMRKKLQTSWRELMTEYTQRNITKRKDIMPAISSIAARMHSFIDAPYLAGLWHDRFIEDLCWRPSAGMGENVPPISPEQVDLNLPSWSWMAVAHAVSYAVIDTPGVFVAHCDLVGGDSMPTKSSNVFAKLDAGREVVLEGRMIAMHLLFHGHHRRADAKSASIRLDTYDKSYSSDVLYDAPLVATEAVLPSGNCIKTVRKAREGDELAWFKDSVVYCLDVGRFMPGGQPHALSGVDHHFVMILVPSLTTPGAYERIGMTSNDFGSGYKGKTRRDVWGDLPVQRITLV
ncbi:heterokaryon incompatibility protein-domain-containing protein [Dactylonectria estremocensis]|uniref:Heterokaryon incompatibility protein-domain-containing protein n=1 Tax=Dactylonectria estremocensis TaxID=1079267 RepID=A0A9P9FER2_9HYPO|nr:heterokaryon incompatibility protein-domain-containing protein [Dactylonectria estremocensis]